MSSSYMRFFETVPPSEEGTILTMSMSAQHVVEEPAFQDFLARYELELQEVDPQHFICLGEDGVTRMSWREVILAPPLDLTTRVALAGILVTLVDSGHNFTNVVDCTADPKNKYSPTIARA